MARARQARSGRSETTDLALVLRRFPYGESSLLVHVLTRRHGRLSLLAKGAYRVQSGYFGVLDLFDRLSLRWRKNPRSDLGLVVGGAVEARRRKIPGDLERYRRALAMLELASLGAREAHEEEALFELLDTALEQLHREATPRLVAVIFALEFLSNQGLAPAFEACAACGAAGPDGEKGRGVPFSVARGGRLCLRCADERPQGVERQPLNRLQIARSLLETPIGLAHRARLEPRRVSEVHDLVRRFLEYHLETRPRSWGPMPRPKTRRSDRAGTAR